LEINVDLTPIKFFAGEKPVQTISLTGSRAEPLEAHSRVFCTKDNTAHDLAFYFDNRLLAAACGCLHATGSAKSFKQTNSFKPSEFQALNIKLDYGHSPEPQRLSRREKIALKLTQITKTIN
jgi:hypothetical protein